MKNSKETVISRSFVDGKQYHECRQHRLVYTDKDGSTWISIDSHKRGKRVILLPSGEYLAEFKWIRLEPAI